MHCLKNSLLKKLVYNSMVLAFFGLAFVACDNKRYYEQDEMIGNDNTWYYQDAKEFKVDIEDSLQVFNFYINVRNTVDYDFANLYVFILSKLPDGVLAQDTVEFQLADYKGNWLGNGRGEFRDNSFIIRKNMRFQHPGTYLFSLKQGMRQDSLKGIADIGIRIEKAY